MSRRRRVPSPTRGRRLRAGLRRHGLTRRPQAIRHLARRHRLHFYPGNRVELYSNGREGLKAMLDAIESARRTVHLETYILRSDETGCRFIDALSERAAAGLGVRLLYDAFGSYGISSEPLERLREAGGAVVAFNPLTKVYPLLAPRRRDHRKLLIVDGRVAFTGGLNIGDEYDQGLAPGDEGWRDTHVRLEGPVVHDLEAVFLESWFRADGPDLPWREILATEPEPSGEVRCAVFPDGPVYRRRRMRELLVGALEETRQEALLATAYFAPGRRLLAALSEAGRRGVAVDLLLAGRTDHPVLRRAAQSILPQLLRRGVRVHDYRRAMMHAKVAIFDGQYAIVGSSNLDRQSFEHSYEVNLVLQGGDVPGQLRRAFERDLEGAARIDAATLASRSLRERLLDRLASLLLLFV
jgi:cardiolipin synthase